MNINFLMTKKMESLFIDKDNVLDFTNDTFTEFFRKTIGINISDDDYWHVSPSMAKRLKYFWEEESEELVAKINLELLELWFYITPDEHKDYEHDTYMDCLNYNQKLLSTDEKIEPTQVTDLTKKSERSSYFPENRFGLFISHRDKDKVFAKSVKDNLEIYGISSFVAHKDIKPSAEWVLEIEKALFSMDALIAILKKGFSESVWTNQEVGVAYGRNIFVLSVRLGEDPSGFVGKFQGLTPPSKDIQELCNEIALHLLNNPKTWDKMQKAYFQELENMGTYADSEQWAQIFYEIETSKPENINILIDSYNANSQATGCFALNGSKFDNPKSIADQINEWLGENKYIIDRYGKIETRK